METVKIKSQHPESQGPFVVIDAEHFDSEKHELWTPEEVKQVKQEPPVIVNPPQEPVQDAPVTDPTPTPVVQPWAAPVAPAVTEKKKK